MNNSVKLCRLCVTENGELLSLFSPLNDVLEENITTLADVFVRLTSATVGLDDGFPLNICSVCAALMHTAYIFVLKYERSFELLKNHLSEIQQASNSYGIQQSSSDYKIAKALSIEIDETGDSCEMVKVLPKEIQQAGDCLEVAKVLPNEIQSVRDCCGNMKVLPSEIRHSYGIPREIQQYDNFCNEIISNDVMKQADEIFLVEHDYALGNDIKIKIEPSSNENMKKISVEMKVKQEVGDAKIKKLHQCPICTAEFKATDLPAHLKTHKSLKKYLSIPNEFKVKPSVKFYYKQNPAREIVSIHRRSIKLHKCLHCEIELPALDLREHMRSLHGMYTCDQCDRVFKRINHLNMHKIKHMKEYPYHCGQCGKGFVIEKNYSCHMLTHKTEEYPYQCADCGRGFYNPEHLHRHQFIHTENITYTQKYSVYSCPNCLKSFKSKEDLKEHNCVPVAVKKSFKCGKCGVVFKNGSALSFHRKRVHKEKREVKPNTEPPVKNKIKTKKVLCAVCGKCYTNYSIYAHMSTHKQDRFLDCPQCGKLLSGKQQLKQHLLVHTGEKPFVCHVCGKSFNKMYNLQVHERIHTGNRRHVCAICNKGFLEKSYLRKHMNVHKKSQL